MFLGLYKLEESYKNYYLQSQKFNLVLKVYWIILTQNHYSSLWYVFLFFFFLKGMLIANKFVNVTHHTVSKF